jgi:hypothetical protein
MPETGDTHECRGARDRRLTHERHGPQHGRHITSDRREDVPPQRWCVALLFFFYFSLFYGTTALRSTTQGSTLHTQACRRMTHATHASPAVHATATYQPQQHAMRETGDTHERHGPQHGRYITSDRHERRVAQHGRHTRARRRGTRVMRRGAV